MGAVKTEPAAGLVSATEGARLATCTVVLIGAESTVPSFTVSVTVKVPTVA